MGSFNKNIKFIALFLSVFVWSSLFGAGQNDAPPVPSISEEYRIVAGDLLFINVWKAPEMTGEFLVGPDGVISLPLIGEIKAAGETRKGLAKKITISLLIEYKNPVVTVQIRQYTKKYVYVIGRVQNPGMVTLYDEPNLVKAIALAGGILSVSRDSRAELAPSPLGLASIIRGNDQIITVNLDELLYSGKTELNVSLLNGDVVNIYQNQTAIIYVMGEVKYPGLYELRQGMTLIDAIAVAGGYTKDAQAHSVRVVRTAGSQDAKFHEILELDLYDIMKRNLKEQNVPLKAGDIVFMPEKGVSKFNYYMDRIIPNITRVFLGYRIGTQVADTIAQ